MNSVTQPVKQPRSANGPWTVKDWLDALSSDECETEDFLRGVEELLRKAPDSGWELLGLVDQYYRRGKISAQMFGSLKTHLQGLMVGKARSDEVSAPPRMQDEPAAPTLRVPTLTNGLPNSRPQPAPPAARPVPAARVPAATTALAPPRSTPPAISAQAPAVAPTPTIATPQRPPSLAAHAQAQLADKPSAPAPHAVAAATSAATPQSIPGPGFQNAARATTAQPSEPSPRALTVGDTLRGRYRVKGLVGQGAMGTVYAAVDQYRLDRSHGEQKVAIKVLHTEVIKRPRLFAELRREFQHLQSLSHPNIVRVHEFDRDGDLAFFTMEYLSGTLLSRVIAAQESATLHRPYALAMIRDIGAAVAHAHERSVVHGDLNPGNIFVTDDGEIRVLDFGASHQIHKGPWISDFDNQHQIRVATPGYASCQVLEGETAEARDDVFSLACIAYVLLSGERPFRDHTALRARSSRMTPARPDGLTQRQWSALRAGLHFDREKRPADVRDWLAKLDLRGAVPKLPPLLSLQAVRRRSARRTGWWVALPLAVLCSAVAWWALARDASRTTSASTLNHVMNSVVDQAITFELWSKEMLAPRHRDTAVPVAAATDPPPEVRSAEISPPVAPAAPRTNASQVPVATRPVASKAAPAVANGASTSTAAPAAVHARIDLAADNVEVAPADPIAHIVVRRTRNLRGDVSFSWWTESGTAKPGRDFVPVRSQVEHLDDGQASISLIIPVVVDPTRRESRNFYVVIDQPSDNATLGSHTLTMVTVPGASP